MPRLHLLFALALSLVTAPAAAQEGSSRAGRALSLTAEVPALWLSADRVYAPNTFTPLSACGPRGCAPVVGTESCAPPECPGHGHVHQTARPLADVPSWPTDHDGYHRALDAARADPRLAALAGLLQDHPDHAARAAAAERDRVARERDERRRSEDVAWVNRYREGDRLELSFTADVGAMADLGGSYAGGSASIGYVWLMGGRDADEDGGSGWLPNFIFGDVLGLELRVHFLHRLDQGQSARWVAAVGLSPVMQNRYDDSVVRAASFWDAVVPEVGAILRDDTDTTWYVAWDLPFSILLDHDVALDLVARMFVIDDWVELPADAEPGADDPAELLFTFSAGVRIP